MRAQRCVLYTRFGPAACRTFLKAALLEAQANWAEKRGPKKWMDGSVTAHGFSLSASAGRASGFVTSGRFVPTHDATRVEVRVARSIIGNASVLLASGWAALWAWQFVRAAAQSTTNQLTSWVLLSLVWLVIGLLPLVLVLLLREQPEDEPTGLNLVRTALDATDEPGANRAATRPL
jgi:hypothetical protein